MSDSNKEIVSRLNRVSGQVAAISKMIQEGKKCESVLTQFKAAQSALDNAFAKFLFSNMNSCLKNKTSEDLDKIIHLITKNKFLF